MEIKESKHSNLKKILSSTRFNSMGLNSAATVHWTNDQSTVHVMYCLHCITIMHTASKIINPENYCIPVYKTLKQMYNTNAVLHLFNSFISNRTS